MKAIIQKTIARVASLLLGVMATASVSAAEATYIDANGDEQTAENAVVVTSSTTTFEDGGWYVVNGTVSTGMITVNGTANLILADGATLTATGTAKYDPGIKVTSGNTLAIYGQSAGTGVLSATGRDSKAAGIGGGSSGDDGVACGTVKIYGGNITATGTKGAAGIGGGGGSSSKGSGGAGGTVEIYGGTVTATAGAVNGSSYGAGIGGGVANNNRASNGTLTVAKGMTVVAGTDEASATARTPDAETGAVTISTSGTADRYFLITAPTALAQTESDLGEVEQGAEKSWNLADTLEGNVTPYVFSGEVPAGFTFSDGVLTLGDAAGGIYNITLTVAGSGAPRLSKPVEFTWTVTVLSAPKAIVYMDGENVLDLAPASYRPGIGATLPTPEKTGYDFGGWYTNAVFEGEVATEVATTETEDLTFYSKWTVTNYSIVYMDGEAAIEGLEPITYTINDAVTLPTDVTKTGYDFGGWYTTSDFTGDAVTEIVLGTTGNKTFYSKWTAISYNIVYMDGSTVIEDLVLTNYTVEAAETLPTPEKTGYDFGGWYTTSELTGDAVTEIALGSTEDKTFYSKWTATVYTITYLDGSTPLDLAPAFYTIEAAETLPAATKEGKDFIGWYTNSGFTGDAVAGIDLGSTGNQTFYAKFVPSRAPATYIDADGVEQTAPLCITIDDTDPETYAFEDGGWYVVKSDATFASTLSIPANASVNLILADGATLTVTVPTGSGDTRYLPGIEVSATSTLSIYAQGEGSGTLEATGAERGAGIGGTGNGGACGTVTIYGGQIIAQGGTRAAGIGGAGTGSTGTGGAGGTVTVYGGSVTATGGQTGIGGGRNAASGTLTVAPGMVVTGEGTTTVTISEPADLAQSETSLENGVEGAGTTWNLAETVTGGVAPYVFSGTATEGFSFTEAGVLTLGDAKGGDYSITLTVTDSGSKRFVQSKEFTWTVTILNAPKTITYMDGAETLTGLEPTQYNPGVAVTLPTDVTKTGYDFGGWYTNAELTGDAVTEVSTTETEDLTFYSKWTATVYTITYMDGDTAIEGLVPTTYTVEAAATLPETAEKSGYGFYGWFDNSATTGDEVTEIPAGTTGDKVFYAKWGLPWTRADYIDAAGNSANERCVVVTSSTRTLEGGNWYVVTENTTVSGTITVSGSVNLVLADNATLTVSGGSTQYNAGIAVPTSSSLTIYAQGEGTGAIAATGAARGAGIGGSGSAGAACGTVNIYGGSITATGGQYAAGIGGAGAGRSGTGGNGGTIAVYAGTVTATGGTGATGIGGGVNSSSANPGSEGSLYVETGMVVTTSGTTTTITEPGALVQSESALADAEESVAAEWNLAETVSGGVPGYTFSGELPEGFTVTEAGVLTLTTAKAGNYDITLTVTDSGAGRLRKSVEFTWTVTILNAPQAIVYMDGEDELTGLEPTQYNPGIEKSIETAVPAKTGYTFEGWYDNAELTGDAVTAVPTTATDTQTFFAKWAAINYNIVYKDGETTLNLAPATYTIEDEVTLPSATKENKVFDGWYKTSAFLPGDKVTAIALGTTEDQTFYAKFVPAKAPATYIDADGAEQTAAECVTIDPDDVDTYTFVDGGWYVVDGTVAFTSTLAVPANASVNLILADGATLTVEVPAGSSNDRYLAGIAVPADSSLSIYAQGEGTGTLSATGAGRGAGIGGSGTAGVAGGTVTIYGGNITATGNQNAAGIGGSGAGNTGTGGAGGTVTIYGGTVTATGGTSAIGGGRNAASGSLTIAPGMSDTGAGTTRTISEPAALAQSVAALDNGVEGEGTVWNLAETITGGVAPYKFSGEVTGFTVSEEGVLTLGNAAGGNYDITLTVADSGSTRFAQSKEFTWTVTILNAPASIVYMDGEETLTGLEPTQYNPGVEKPIATAVPEKTGYDFAGWFDNADCEGDAVTAVPASATGTQTFYAGWTAKTYTIKYMDGNTELTGLAPASYTIEDEVTLPATAEKTGYGFYGWFDNADCEGDEVTVIPAGTTGPQTFYASFGEPWVAASYIGADGKEATAKSVVVTSSTTTFEDGGWYVVNGAVATGTITVNGSANLILADGATLTAAGTEKWYPGVRVSVGNTLSIYAQSAGTGALVASGNESKAAGIGGGSLESGKAGESCGTVRIYGGNITATGTKGAAGIGGGAGSGSDSTKMGGNGGIVEVYGGFVTATGGADNGTGRVGGAGIGSGDAAGGVTTGGTFVNYGGTVIATGIAGAADIGAADGGASATFTIVGGSTYLANGTKTGDATDGNGNTVYCVTVPDLDASTKYVFKNLGDYGQANIVSDAGGKVYLWLADGDYAFKAVGYEWTAKVNGENTTATRDMANVEVEKVVETALVSVPEVCTVATLVDTTDEKRDVGDKIVAFNTETGKYDTWQLALVGEDLVWEPVARMSTGSDVVEYPATANEYALQSGQAVWVQRVNENKPIVLNSKYSVSRNQTVDVTSGWTLLAPLPKAGEAAYDLNAITVQDGEFSDSDKIVISGNESPVNCFRKDGEWKVYTGTVEADGEWGAIFTGGEWVPAPKIAEGEGFFFVTEGSKTLKF